jgi:hypothetical protein
MLASPDGAVHVLEDVCRRAAPADMIRHQDPSPTCRQSDRAASQPARDLKSPCPRTRGRSSCVILNELKSLS